VIRPRVEDYDGYLTRKIAKNAVEQVTIGKTTTSILALIHFSDVPIAVVIASCTFGDVIGPY
jgi:hypothetical protein